MADHLRNDGVRAATITYGLTMAPASICFAFFWYYAAIGRRLIAETTDQSVVTGLSRRMLPGLPINAGATLVTLWSPYTDVGESNGARLVARGRRGRGRVGSGRP